MAVRNYFRHKIVAAQALISAYAVRNFPALSVSTEKKLVFFIRYQLAHVGITLIEVTKDQLL
jgi:hypothetical protein